ncbi:MAG: hypothetical protein RMM30_00580 [Armatimonadota bacterium]|nr:hypothetical protein [Armatimonadota bacterium]MDW8155072.1 hypothetical protein [Armatimonadota bacterium]
MRVWWIAAVAAALAVGCSRSPAPPVRYEDPLLRVAVEHPHGWEVLRSGDGRWLQVVPRGEGPEPDALRYTEFLSVRVVPGRPPDQEDALRQEAFSLLPFHGVAKFQREEGTDPPRYRFEGTGSAMTGQWAAVGLLFVQPDRLVHVVCAKPLDRWREGQRECDRLVDRVETLP